MKMDMTSWSKGEKGKKNSEKGTGKNKPTTEL